MTSPYFHDDLDIGNANLWTNQRLKLSLELYEFYP